MVARWILNPNASVRFRDPLPKSKFTGVRRDFNPKPDIICGYGRIGRHQALKMPRCISVPVRVRLPAPLAKLATTKLSKKLGSPCYYSQGWGSTPLLFAPQVLRQHSGFLIRQVGVQIPGGAPYAPVAQMVEQQTLVESNK